MQDMDLDSSIDIEQFNNWLLPLLEPFCYWTSEICGITCQSSLGVFQNAPKMAANVELVNRAWAVITDTLTPGVKKVDRQ